MNWVVSNLTAAGGFVLGRRTYEGFARHRPNASKEEQPIAQPLNAKPKYVASTTLSEPLEWNNTTLLHGDLGHAINALNFFAIAAMPSPTCPQIVSPTS